MGPIVIRTKKQAPDAHHPEGVAADQEFEVESLVVAKRVYPGARVLRYANGDAWDGPKYARDEPKEPEPAPEPEKTADDKPKTSKDEKAKA